MFRMNFDFEKAKLNGVIGIIALTLLVLALVFLSLFLLDNPHKKLHQAVFDTADSVRLYYRDRPGYWHLSTESAKKDGLLKKLAAYSDFKISIGRGTDGDVCLPSDLSFDITLKNLNKSACINLLELQIPEKQQLGLMKVVIINDADTTEFSWGGKNALPIKKYSARNICAPQNNIISWTFQ